MTTPNAPKAAAPAVAEAELEPMQSDWPIGRAAEMLTAYAELVKATGRYAEEHYIPEVEHVISELRLASVAALAAAPQQVAAWMPIQTAPKDGTHVLTWWAGAARVGWVQGAGQSRDGGDWWNTHERVAMAAGEARPTHWQPLPAPPSQASATGEV